MRKRHFFFSLLAAASLTACDYIEGPKVDQSGFPTTGRKVLLEDFTGHQCGSCPRAHEKAKELHDIFGENLVIVGVHVGSFAEVDVPHGYLDDFTTPMGNDLMTHYDPYSEGLPVGLVNRLPYNNLELIKYPNWSAAISQILAQDPRMAISIEPNYDAGSRALDITVEMTYYEEGNANDQLVVVITEDSVNSQQADYSLPAPSHIENYKQLHVLRGSVTAGSWGEQVKPSTIFAGEKVVKTYSTILDANWDPAHCEIVAYVLDKDTKQVHEVQSVHLAE